MSRGNKTRRGRRIVDMSARYLTLSRVGRQHASTIRCQHLNSHQLRAELRKAKKRGSESRALINARICYKCRPLLVAIES